MGIDQIRSVDHTVILCTRLAETRRFYRDVMGFAIEVDREHWVSFRVGGTLLSLRQRGPWAVCDDGPSMPGSAAVQLAFRVPPPAIESCHAELIARGVPILRGPTDIPHSRHRTLFFRDPEGNILEIYAEY